MENKWILMGKTVENSFLFSLFSVSYRFFPQIRSFAIFHSFFHNQHPVENSPFLSFSGDFDRNFHNPQIFEIHISKPL